jgi:hypothetical protein
MPVAVREIDMETTLLIVTTVSLIVALAMSFTAWRLGRQQRERAAARVAALSVAAGIVPAEWAVTSANADHVAPRVVEDHMGSRVVELPKAPWTPSRQAAVVAPPAHDQLRDFADRLNPDAVDKPQSLSPHESRPILGSAEEPKASGERQRGLAAAAAVLFVVLLGGLAWTMTGREQNVASAAAPGAPLELVSLRHERQSSKLAVSGLVRNPAAGHPVEHLSAVVFLFDQQGAFVASAKAPVDFVRLGSGDESPFVITLDAPANIARYRVSFRTDQGIVPHVDRRGASPIASQAEQAASLPVK